MLRLTHAPAITNEHGLALASFDDPHHPHSGRLDYVRSILWVTVDPQDRRRVTSTQGVRLLKTSDAVDLDGMSESARKVWTATTSDRDWFAKVPRIVAS